MSTAGSLFRLKAAICRSLDFEDISNREAKLTFSSVVMHGSVRLSLGDVLCRFRYENVVYSIIRIKELLLSSFKSLKNVIY